MVRHTDTSHTPTEDDSTPGKGALGAAVDLVRALLSDSPHEPGQSPVGPGALGLEWK